MNDGVRLNKWEENDGDKKLGILFANALAADYSQSVTYFGKVTSIQYVIANNQNDPVKMASALEDALDTYYSRWNHEFTDMNIDVTHTLTEGENEYVLDISITGLYKDKPVSLLKSMLIEDSVLKKTIDTINR